MNLPLKSAKVTIPAGVSVAQIIDTVNAIGYKTTLKTPAHQGSAPGSPTGSSHLTGPDPALGMPGIGSPSTGVPASLGADTVAEQEDAAKTSAAARKIAGLKRRLIIAAGFTLPVTIISMLPAAQFPHWGWVVLALSLLVVTWAAWPSHRVAAINARHLSFTMDTLISIGVAAARDVCRLHVHRTCR
ncbi:cation transport ATPase [Arthrobacter sp. CAN_A6]